MMWIFLKRLFFNYLYGEPSKEIKQKLLLGKNNRIISLDYSVSNNTPKVFEIIEFNFRFKTSLNLDSLRFKSISLLFNNQDRNKVNFFKIN